MKITFDDDKNAAKHGVDFADAAYFDWQSAQAKADARFDYGEPRFIATGYLRERLHILVFTPRDGGIRIISFRKANKREIKQYEQTAN